MPSISGPEIIVILVIALIVLGPRRLPEMARSAGRGLREFRSALSSDNDDDRDGGPAEKREEPSLTGRPSGSDSA